MQFVDEVLPNVQYDVDDGEDGHGDADGEHDDVPDEDTAELSDNLRRRWTRHIQNMLRNSNVAIPVPPDAASSKRASGTTFNICSRLLPMKRCRYRC